MSIEIIRDKLSQEKIIQLARETFGDMVKVVVDIKRAVLAAGGELHADAESALIDDGSEQKNLWGANIYPDRPAGHRVEYTSLINIRPSQGNPGQSIQDEAVRDKVQNIIREKTTDII